MTMISGRDIMSVGLVLMMCGLYACQPPLEKNDRITTKVFNYPVLKGKTNNPILRITIEADSLEAVVEALKLNIGSAHFLL
ncbi:MAG: hypothetical protein JEZ14_15255 [Marinilabiliaceae bacterium]|nr:hypothetical protein [Marinilabiliaceae bacterium]